MQVGPAPRLHWASSVHGNGTVPMQPDVRSWTRIADAGKMVRPMDERSATDLELLDRWRAGDRGAADALTSRYYTSVLRFFELRLPRAADDLTQAVFLACVEGQTRFQGTGTFKAYLFGIARMTLLEQLRARERKLTRFDEADQGDGRLDLTSLSTLIARRQEQQLVLQSLVALPPQMLVELQLYYWEGLATKEIAEVLGIPASTVTTHLARARERLRTELEVLTRASALRHRLLADVEGWVRSVAGGEPPAKQS